MKKIFASIFAVIFVLSTMLCLPPDVSAESLYIRKIVSVVCDDSGSMNGDKWAYADYAMQAFCGMLNSEDKLFITYMRSAAKQDDYEPEKIDLSADGIQNSIEAVKAHSSGGSTPYKAVEIAYDKLKSTDDSNPNTQYWLVIITDGVFDECASMSENEERRFLDERFGDYTNCNMPNGTKPQITFLAIGDDVVSPNEGSGIYTYSAKNAGEITSAMSEMADRVSGRTRLEKSDIKQIDDKTIQVFSSIPLLNIAVFAQNSGAKITGAIHGNEISIPISREAVLNYPGYSELVGGAYLLGDSQKVIGAGTNDIAFDKKISLDDIVVLFEPALEVRMTLLLNGKKVSDYSELDNASEGDKISVSSKIYEMWTDTEISPSLMPPNTKFAVTVSEGGKNVVTSDKKEMLVSDYTLKNIQTEIVAAVFIEGFNPIKYSAKFTPSKFVPKVVYTIEAGFKSGVRNVRLDDIGVNKELAVCFTVYADGTALTNPSAVRALSPVISVSPKGNDGTVLYSDDGKIVFTPNTASAPSAGGGSFDVDVTCTIDGGMTATGTYTVLISSYQVIPVGTDEVIKKTSLFDNRVGTSFYITKDGAKLGKSAVEKGISVAFNAAHSDLKSSVDISEDGTITVTPYSDEEHVLNFRNWWTNWAYYFGLESKDITVTLNHALGSASSTIDVVGAGAKYVVLNVCLPLITEILILAAIIAYVIRYFTKARFASNGVLYTGAIRRNLKPASTHSISLTEVRLNQYNKFKNLWNPFRELTVSVNGIDITAASGNRIICNEPFPWYSDAIHPRSHILNINSPRDVVDYCQVNEELVIQEIRTTHVMDEQNRVISQDDSVYYFTSPDIIFINHGAATTEVIDSAVAFCYSTCAAL